MSAAAARRRRQRRSGRLAALATLGALGVAGVSVGTIVLFLNHAVPPTPPRLGCTATLDDAQWRLSLGQADNAALIAAVSLRREMPARAATIGLATALQESQLINIDYGDRDSVGLFQQRTSQGWGTVEEIMDPVYSTNAFFDGLANVPDYPNLPVTEAAQAVQRSGFPDAYAQHEDRSRAWASALTGHTTAAITCITSETSLDPAAVDVALTALEARLLRDFGPLSTIRSGGDLVVDVSALGADAERLAWALAQWSVATAQETEVQRVYVSGQVWSRNSALWSSDEPDTTLTSAQVRLMVTTPESSA